MSSPAVLREHRREWPPRVQPEPWSEVHAGYASAVQPGIPAGDGGLRPWPEDAASGVHRPGEAGEDPSARTFHLNGDPVILAANPPGGPGHRLIHRSTLPAGSAGHHRLQSRTGANDPDPAGAHQRVIESVRVNGLTVLSPVELDAATYAHDVVVSRVEGENTIDVELHRAEGDAGLAFLTAWLESWG